MSTLSEITLRFGLGDTILVGKKSEPATITKIEYHPRSGDVTLGTTKGPRSALTFRLPCSGSAEGADKYR